MERAGVVYDNQEHQVTVQMDSNCFSVEQIQNMGANTSMNVALRASKPTFFAAKVGGATVECLSSEDQTAVSADVYDGRSGQYSARPSSIKGNVVDGLKARYFHVQSTNTDADLGDSSKYSEVVNNRCYKNGADQDDCGANTGIAFPQNGPFVFGLHPTTNATTSLTWAAQLQGLKFSSVSFADVQ